MQTEQNTNTRVQHLEALAQAVAPLVAAWREQPKLDEGVGDKRRDVALAYAELEKSASGAAGATPTVTPNAQSSQPQTQATGTAGNGVHVGVSKN